MKSERKRKVNFMVYLENALFSAPYGVKSKTKRSHVKQTSPLDTRRMKGARGANVDSPTLPSHIPLESGRRLIKNDSDIALGKMFVNELRMKMGFAAGATRR